MRDRDEPQIDSAPVLPWSLSTHVHRLCAHHSSAHSLNPVIGPCICASVRDLPTLFDHGLATWIDFDALRGLLT